MTERSFRKVLVANRGEIAIRIFRACYDLGLHTVAIYSNEDTYGFFRTRADEAYLIGENKSPLKAYLDIPSIIDLAKHHDVDAIHPGYGFLSENADFARACEEACITFIGPPSHILSQMGDKLTAKAMHRPAVSPPFPVPPSRCATQTKRSKRQSRSVYRSSSRQPVAAAAAACGAVTLRKRSLPRSSASRARPRRRSAMRISSSRSTWLSPSTSKYRCWATSTATSSTSASATARSSAATRRSSSSRRPGRYPRQPVRLCTRMPSRLPVISAISRPVRWNFWWTSRATTISSR